MKYFCVGANKTGTTSCRDVFRLLGLKKVSIWKDGKRFIKPMWKGNYEGFLSMTEKFTSMQDAPFSYLRVPILKMLKKKYPTAKFILTYRRSEEWLGSLIKWHQWHVGYAQESPHLGYCIAFDLPPTFPCTPLFIEKHKKQFIRGYERRNEEITNFFKGDPNFLAIDITKESNRWEKLCSILNQPLPSKGTPFPHSNPAKSIKK